MAGRGRGTLLEPAVLASLARAQAHGYDLRRTVEEITQGAVVCDPGGLYRILRRLEEDDLVTSRWVEGEAGPQRREYTLTDGGRELLRLWHEDLRERQRVFGAVASVMEEAMGAPTAEPPTDEGRTRE
jgi:PadR family transcriptional regulator, regulatory protein PadR